MTKDQKLRLGLLAVSFIAILWGFQSMLLDHAPGAFRSPDEDMGYGWYVPLFSIYVLWTERKRILESLGEPSWTGAMLVVPSLFIGFLGVRGTQLRLEILGFSLLLISLAWSFFGKTTARRIAFPAVFLWFCMPFTTYLDAVTVHLRLFATSTAAGILGVFSDQVVRVGTMISSADGTFAIDVASPCSGLRSLFALMALTAGYAYFNQPTLPRKLLLFAFSIPIAIVGNIVRILTIAVVGTCFSADFATGFYHDYSGYIVFLVAIALMLATSALIAKGAGKCAR